MKERNNKNRIDQCLAMIKRLKFAICLIGALAPISTAVAGPEDPEDGGQWGPVLAWPHIAVSAANLPDGRILTFSGSEPDTWPADERTYSATWDPQTGVHVEILHQGHNMFCAHLALLEDGTVFVNGGRNKALSKWTSLFDFDSGSSGQWTQIEDMATGGRWYPTTVALPNGSVFTAIGDASNQDNPETWDPVNGWQIKNSISFNDMVLSLGGFSEKQWWPLLHVAPNGEIFHSGPTPNMHYIDTTGNGSYSQVGPAMTDWYHKHGTTVMYAEGKLLTAGGWVSGFQAASTNRVFTIDLNNTAPVVTVMPVDTGNPLPALTKSMHFARKFHNGVVAPNGEVYVIGGNTSGTKFSDNGAVLEVEIWNPVTEEWRIAAAMDVARNYHSVALLLTDGRILSAGGGYCSSSPVCNNSSHQDAQVYTPPYLFDQNGNLAARPSITSGPGFVSSNQTFNVQATPGMQKFSMVKMSSTTHGMNTDVRFLDVTFSEISPGSYDLQANPNPNVLTPGYWMLFALDANGVPSVAHVIRANSGSGLPWIDTPANQSTAIGGNVSLQMNAGDGDGDTIAFSAVNLPPGLTIDSVSGLITGVPTTVGVYQTMVTVDDSDEGTADANFQWTVFDPVVTCPDCLDFNVVTTSSYSNQDQHANVTIENAGLALALADNTQRRSDLSFNIAADTVLEFDFFSDAQGEVQGIGFDETNSHTDATRTFQLFGTQNWAGANHDFDNYNGGGTVHYTIPVGTYYTGSNMHLVFTNDFDAAGGIGSSSKFSNVRVVTGGDGNISPTINNPASQLVNQNDSVNFVMTAVDPNIGDVLSFSDGGSLPPGLTISSSGVVTGTATTVGTFNVSITADDGNGGTDVAQFQWSVCDPVSGCSGNFLDFNSLATTPYSNQDEHANISSADGGLTAVLADNTQRKTVQTYNITEFTVLEFDFESADEPEISGIGFDENNSHSDGQRVFAVYGTQAYSGHNQDFNDYAGGGPKHYVIPVGSYYTGSAMYLVLVNDNDAGSGIGTESRFSNVQIYEAGSGELAEVVDPIATQSGMIATLSIQPNFQGLMYNWNFGDLTGDTGFVPDASIDHTYSAPGLYTVTVTVLNPATSEQTQYSFVQLVHAPLTINSPSVSGGLGVHPVQPQIWNVNPDNDSVTVIDSGTNTVLAEIFVGDKPASVGFAPDSTAWVVNKGSATISIIDSASLNVVQTISLDHASQPHGIAFSPAASEAFVTLEATGELVKIDASLRTEQGRVFLGPDIRHLSVVANGSSVYVSRFVTPRVPNEFTDAPIVQVGQQFYGGEVLVVDPGTMSLDKTIVLRWSADFPSEHDGPGLPNYLGPPVISPDDLGIWVPSKQDNILAGGSGGLRTGPGMTFDQTVRAVTSKIDRLTDDELLSDRIDHDNASVASHAAFGPYGVYLYTALEGNREIAVSNAYTGVELFKFDVGRAPQSVAISDDGLTLYVHNFTDRSVGAYDISEITLRNELIVNQIATISTVSAEALSPTVLLGKQLFYDARDPRLSSGPYMSCASCHNDGGSDKRVWDFTSVGEGLRNTITLEGRSGMGHGHLHWSANFDEVQDFEAQIRNFSGGTGLMDEADFTTGTRSLPLGDPKAGISADLDALASYVASLNQVPNSPYRNSDGTLSIAGEAGKLVYETNGCGTCHTPTNYTDSSLPTPTLHDVGTITTASGSRLGGPLTGLDTPTLLGVWQSAPYLHDGSALDITEAISAHSGVVLSSQELQDLGAYLLELDSVTADGCADCLSFITLSTSSYSPPQDEFGNVAIEDGGLALSLTDNTHRRTDATFTVTATTVLEFDFESAGQGEVHGIGFDEDNNISGPVRVFQLYGTQNWSGANSDFKTYTPGGPVHYTIPVGSYYTGSNMHLVFLNDNDAGSRTGNSSRFSNVRVVTNGDGNLSPTISNPGTQTTDQNDPVNLAIFAADPNIGDSMIFSGGASLPPGLSLDTAGNITGTPTTIGNYNVVISVSDGNGGGDVAAFVWSVCDPVGGCGVNYLDFNLLPTSSYSNQDEHGNITVENGGLTIALADNTQRQTSQTFNITANTVLEFDFDSTDEGEIHGIGFDENNVHNDGARVFALYGTQTWSGNINVFNDYVGGGPKHYVIPVGQYYTGSSMHLVLVNDNDAGSGIGTNGRFSNVQIYDVP